MNLSLSRKGLSETLIYRKVLRDYFKQNGMKTRRIRHPFYKDGGLSKKALELLGNLSSCF